MKNNKGITLIALIITIIVMLILVAVTVAVVVNSNLIGTAQGAKTDTETAYSEESNIAGFNVTIGGEDRYFNNADEYVDYLKGNSGEGAKWELTTDSGETGLSEGDLVTHKERTTEQFYVIKVTGNTVAMLAAKNITTTGQLEQSDSAPTVAFSNTNYWSSETSYPLDLNEYTDKTDIEKTNMGVVSTDAIEIARAYGDTFDVKGRLMTVGEVEDLGGSKDDYSTEDCPSFINTQDYWLGSASFVSDGYHFVWIVIGEYSRLLSNGIFSSVGSYGVRPVLEVLTSSIE